MKKTVILVAGIALSILFIAAVATTIDDFFLPGSQPGESGNLEHPNKCDNCHGGYNHAVEPAFNWRGSMMAQAARDPLFYACLAIAEQDAPGSGDLCIRCHAPDGWLNGRSTPTDGSALNNNDREGVQCDFCHKLVQPSEIGINPYENDPNYSANTWQSDQDYLGKITLIPPQSGNGMYVAHDENAKRGPFLDAAAKHQIYYSPFHSKSDICGTCHDVSSPVFDKDGNVTSDGLGAAATTFNTQMMLPIERTFSEWKNSDFNPVNNPDGVYSEAFGGNKMNVSTCQDCHMKDVSGVAANKRGTIQRDDLPLHDMTGGNTFIPDLVAALYPDEVNQDALNAGKQRALYMLQNAATMELNVEEQTDGYKANVTVVNNTGHKLPSGYPEGRRIWIQLQAYDSNGHIVYESGAYDPETAVLTKDGTKIYEIKLGMTEDVADLAGITDLPESGESFHFVLNNKVVKDNRIPPRGFTNAAFNAIGSPVLNYEYSDGDFSDITEYSVPNSAAKVIATLYYQTVSKEYIEFLWDENSTNEAGQVLYNLWNDNGKSAPIVMQKVEANLSNTGTPPVADFTAIPVSGEAPLNVQFTSQSIDATSYLWDFGDGGTSAEQNPSHSYNSAGDYTVALTATNEFGSDTETKTNFIIVTGNTGSDYITANFGTWETINLSKGNKQYSVTVTVNPVIQGAEVTGNFNDGTSESITTDNNGQVTFFSPEFKGSASWCLNITNIVADGYLFNGPVSDCTVKSASISGIQTENTISIYPNPFTDKLFFEFTRNEDCAAKIDIYDVSGKKIETLFDRKIKAKMPYKAGFKPQNSTAEMYFYRIQFDDEVMNGKVLYNRP